MFWQTGKQLEDLEKSVDCRKYVDPLVAAFISKLYVGFNSGKYG